MDAAEMEELDINAESALYDYFILNADRARVGEVVMLLAQGAEINYADSFDKTPLHLYLHTRHPRSDVILALMEAGAVVDTPERCCGSTAAHLYILNAAEVDLSVLEAMLTWGVRQNNPHSERLLSSLLRECAVNRAYSDQTEPIMDLLIGMGADVNMPGGVRRTALHACLTGLNTNPCMIRALLRRGASVTATDTYDMTPLAVLLESARATPELVRILVEAGSDVSATDFSLNSMLHHHAQSTRPRASVMRELIRLGCSPVAKNMFGNTPMHTLAMGSSCRRSIILPLLEAGVSVNEENLDYGTVPLHVAAGYNNTRGCLKLLRQGGDPAVVSAAGRTPISNMLVKRNHVAVAGALSTHPSAAVVAQALEHALDAGPSEASRLAVAFVVARAGASALPEAVRRLHEGFVADCEREVALLSRTMLGTPAVSALVVLVSKEVFGTVISSRALRVVREVRVYARPLREALINLRHKCRLVSSLKRQVGPCSLPGELVERVLATVPLADLSRSCDRRAPE
ncbi:Ankyrin/F-box protein [Orf virus]|uniref:Ankyrin/F-box protein n=1 Tax=Orf virus TaxID=10258 RepID=A0A0R8I3D6_ORFV|nr:Ankyrin/F-box protein [Orf virus]ASL69173.1 ankyrin/F-box protein [Orf virus]